jgi:hypothetical protein
MYRKVRYNKMCKTSKWRDMKIGVFKQGVGGGGIKTNKQKTKQNKNKNQHGLE